MWPLSTAHHNIVVLQLTILRHKFSVSYRSVTKKVYDKPRLPLTVKHILVDCSDFTDVQNKHFNVTSMKDLFENVLIDNIINFIKEINFYNQL